MQFTEEARRRGIDHDQMLQEIMAKPPGQPKDLDRDAALTGVKKRAYELVLQTEEDNEALRRQAEQDRQEIARLQQYSTFLEGQVRQFDRDRLTFMRHAQKLASHQKIISRLCGEGEKFAALVGELLPEEDEAEANEAKEMAERLAPVEFVK
jgi:hypothetical protein